MEHLTITGGKSLNDGIWNPVSKSHYIKYYFLWNRKKYNCCFFLASLGKFQGQCQSFLGGFLYYAGLKSGHGLKETVESLNFGF